MARTLWKFQAMDSSPRDSVFDQRKPQRMKPEFQVNRTKSRSHFEAKKKRASKQQIHYLEYWKLQKTAHPSNRAFRKTKSIIGPQWASLAPMSVWIPLCLKAWDYIFGGYVFPQRIQHSRKSYCIWWMMMVKIDIHLFRFFFPSSSLSTIFFIFFITIFTILHVVLPPPPFFLLWAPILSTVLSWNQSGWSQTLQVTCSLSHSNISPPAPLIVGVPVVKTDSPNPLPARPLGALGSAWSKLSKPHLSRSVQPFLTLPLGGSRSICA